MEKKSKLANVIRKNRNTSELLFEEEKERKKEIFSFRSLNRYCKSFYFKAMSKIYGGFRNRGVLSISD
jgi:hypothetical protein